MDVSVLKARKLDSEFLFRATRSSGPGGQNVNKVSTKIKVVFDVRNSSVLSDSEKELVISGLKRRINSAGELIVTSQSVRTQLGNKSNATERMLALIARALTALAERVPTVPTNQSRIERLEEKHKRGAIKKLRKETKDPLNE
ncbi:MAG: alternative ribosome rescue aminoacyl-tRNA hydrolase ArfB [Bacteroidota bacterium]|nr:alternative ribosome rescue aminoacyl-tRNA hydrolase ArfB [Bacteroidota bacterium]